jgi:hypothetical protein
LRSLGVGSAAPNELQRTEAGVERPLPVAVAPVQPLRRALVAPGADQALGVGLHEHLQHGLRHRPQEVALAALLERLDECHPVLGHRVLRSGEARNPTLAGSPDGHLSRSPNFHHDRGRYLRVGPGSALIHMVGTHRR